ncbi:MAG TPA: TetR/AcrR family transcriptional regulator [Kofleriaceae bacterium]|nr:TetR/AcrR family transcriptional regulator [Kofleriaceae bacterium]
MSRRIIDPSRQPPRSRRRAAATGEEAALRPPRLPALRPGPAGGARDANRRERLRQIGDAALDLFLAEGIPGVTIDQIVERAGVAKGSFYRYFRDKEELVSGLLEPLAEVVAALFAGASAALAAAAGPAQVSAAYLDLARRVAEVIAAHPRAALLYLQESRGPGAGARAPVTRLADRVADLAEALSAHARDHGLLRDLDARVQGLVVLGAVERLLYDSLSGRRVGARPDQVSALVVTIILDGVRRR